jgi:hypothetical protein
VLDKSFKPHSTALGGSKAFDDIILSDNNGSNVTAPIRLRIQGIPFLQVISLHGCSTSKINLQLERKYAEYLLL